MGPYINENSQSQSELAQSQFQFPLDKLLMFI